MAEHSKSAQGDTGFNVGLEDENMNIGNAFREADFVTRLVGKLHVGPELKKCGKYEELGLYYPDSDADPGLAAQRASP